MAARQLLFTPSTTACYFLMEGAYLLGTALACEIFYCLVVETFPLFWLIFGPKVPRNYLSSSSLGDVIMSLDATQPGRPQF